jgi:hypothetical protein
MARPSGLPVIEDASATVTVSVAHVEMRGRLNILPRWRQRVGWLKSETADVQALMVLAEPGLISIGSWEPDGPEFSNDMRKLQPHRMLMRLKSYV